MSNAIGLILDKTDPVLAKAEQIVAERKKKTYRENLCKEAGICSTCGEFLTKSRVEMPYSSHSYIDHICPTHGSIHTTRN